MPRPVVFQQHPPFVRSYNERLKLMDSLILNECVVLPTHAKLRTLILDYRVDPRWDTYVSLHPDGLIYHHSSWLIALEEEYGQECLSLACVDDEDHVRSVVPLFPTRGLPFAIGQHSTGRRLASLPRTPTAGPLADNPTALAEIVRAAMQVARERHLQLEIKAQNEDLGSHVDGLQRVSWRLSYVEELPTSVEGESWNDFCEKVRLPRNCGSCKGCRRLRFGNAKQQHRVNWAVNKAVKLGLEVREADTEQDLENWYRLYLQTMRHKAVPPRSYRFFKSLWSTLRPKGQMRLLLAEQRKDDKASLVAGSVFLKFGQTVFYAFTGCPPQNLYLHPHDIIQIEAIRDACKGGFRWYDFGEVSEDNESLAQFKSKWGTEPKPLFRYYYPAMPQRPPTGNAVTSSTRKLWRILPERATAVLGDWIYRYM